MLVSPFPNESNRFSKRIHAQQLVTTASDRAEDGNAGKRPRSGKTFQRGCVRRFAGPLVMNLSNHQGEFIPIDEEKVAEEVASPLIMSLRQQDVEKRQAGAGENEGR